MKTPLLLSLLTFASITASQAQLAPRKAGATALFPRQTQVFGVTIQVDDAGFAPMSRVSKDKGSAPVFFVKWSTPNLPTRGAVRFMGMAPSANYKWLDIGNRSSFPEPKPVDVAEGVKPTVDKMYAFWEVADPKRASEDDGASKKTYELSCDAPTRAKPIVTPATSVVSAHGSRITLRKVECDYDGPAPSTKVTIAIAHPPLRDPRDRDIPLYMYAGLESGTDDTGKTLKQMMLNPDNFMQGVGDVAPMPEGFPQSLGAETTYRLEGVPTDGAKTMKMALTLSEYSTLYRNEASFKHAFIEVPVRATFAASNLLPTPAEAAPIVAAETAQVSATLDFKESYGQWNGVLWLRARTLTVPLATGTTAGDTVEAQWHLKSISAVSPTGRAAELDGYELNPIPVGHNDGSLARDDEHAFSLRNPMGRALENGSTLTINLTRVEMTSHPLRVEVPLPRPGQIIELPADAATGGAHLLKVAVLDEALRKDLVQKSSVMALDLPLGSLVLVSESTPGAGAFDVRSLAVGGRKVVTGPLMVCSGDRLSDNKPGPAVTLVVSAPATWPLPASLATLKLTIEAALTRQTDEEAFAPLTFKGVVFKWPAP